MSAASKRRQAVRTEMLAADYSRYSQEIQSSITEQQAQNRELALDEGVTIVASFSDAAVSRSIQDRPGLLEMFAYVDRHPEVGYIIVNELERLTAGVEQRAQVTKLCQRHNVVIITEDAGRIDPWDETQMHEADKRAVESKGEVLKVQRRTRRTLRQKVIKGTVAMRPAFGTRMKPIIGPDGMELPPGMQLVTATGRRVRSGVLETHPDELPWLVQIFEWADASVPNEQIARRLTEAGVPTKSGNTQWRANTVGGILRNPLYKGEMTWGKQATRRLGDGRTYLEEREEGDPGRVVKPSPLGALVDPALWDRIEQRRLDRPASSRHMTRKSHGPRVLDNRVFCARCGNKMYGRVDNPRSYVTRSWRYYCASSRPGWLPQPGYTGEGCREHAHSMSEKKILAALGTLGADGATSSVRPRQARAVAAGSDRERLNDVLAQARKERKNAQRLAIAGKIDEEMLDEALADADRAIQSATAELAHLDAVANGVEPASVYLDELAPTLAVMAELLADQELPVADRQRALDEAGIYRLYIDLPHVVVEMIEG